MQAGRALLKLGILGWAAWHALSSIVPDAGQTLLEVPGALLDRVARGLLHLALLVLGAQAIFAMLDLVLVRLRYARRMRMSREEQREETKEFRGRSAREGAAAPAAHRPRPPPDDDGRADSDRGHH